MTVENQAPVDKVKAPETNLMDWFLVDFWPKFGMQALYVILGLSVVISGFVWFNNDRIASQAKENKLLGPAYLLYSENKLDSAESFLNAFAKQGHGKFVQDKANLMLGQILYSKAKYDEALNTFSQIDLGNTKNSLVSSGALHGIAACYIEKKNYAQAVVNLEKFISTFGRKTGKPTEKIEGNEVADLSPAVPNAYWKLALCYREMQNVEKEKATVEKLFKAYPQSKEAFDATRLLAQIP